MDAAQQDTVPVAFLLANWYSGATLLTLLLDQHPQIVSNGETFYLYPRTGETICSCGASLRSCPFYREAAGAMWAGTDYDPTLFRVTPTFSRRKPLSTLLDSTRFPGSWRTTLIRSFPGVRVRYDSFFRAHVEFMARSIRVRDARLYLDGTKSLRRAEIFLSEDDFRASSVILLVRHPLSWCTSWMEKRKAAGLDDAIQTWNAYIRRSFRLSKRFPAAPFRVVQYEELCSHPERELAQTEAWLGLAVRDASTRDAYVPHVLGNKMRFTFDGVVRPPTDRSAQLSATERKEIVRRCSRWMRAVGYDPAASV